ncbi:MAG: hydrogenase maturation nickel metallochaperone HypA [Gemmatimonadota bacterium]|nr:MAG: hydrogenase maturation nickel metallochaperone HypA [Gemmatimonadota bacterium]
MHELSIALEVCRMAEERLGRDALERVVALGLEVGDDSGIEADNLEFCLEALLSSPPFGGARPVIVRLPGDVLRLSYLEVEDDDPDD